MGISAALKSIGRRMDAADDAIAAAKEGAKNASKAAIKKTGELVWDGTKAAARTAAPPLAWAGKKAANGAFVAAGAGATVGVKGLTASNKILEKSVGKLGNGLANLAWNHFSPGKLIKYDEEHGYRLNGKGKLVIGGLILGSAGSSMMDENEKVHMGTIDGRIHTATPDYSAYAKMKTPKTTYSPAPAGADGSLVFALDQAKNGGFL